MPDDERRHRLDYQRGHPDPERPVSHEWSVAKTIGLYLALCIAIVAGIAIFLLVTGWVLTLFRPFGR